MKLGLWSPTLRTMKLCEGWGTRLRFWNALPA
jgi:hypothetical protein